MAALRWVPLLLLGTALIIGAEWAYQRRVASVLQEQIALLRVDQRELIRLRAENRRLQAARVSDDELERLRGDHAALGRLRAEVARLRDTIRTREEMAASPPRLLPAGEWKNAGRATPDSALETALWAGASGQLDVLVRTLGYDGHVRGEMDTLFAGLPPMVQSHYGSVERLVAASIAQQAPHRAMEILQQTANGPDNATLVVRFPNGDGSAKTVSFWLHRLDDGWRVMVPPDFVRQLAELAGP